MADREPASGDLLGGRYEIQGELGRGGMATVYRGLDTRLQRRVAVKVFRGGFAEAVDPQRTTQEMRLLAAVNHPCVVSVLDASTGDGVFGAFLVMELVVGDDLGLLLHRARGPLTADFARRIVADVAAALAALHALGVVHRDVKPANILVPTAASSPSTVVAAKLTDFGIAQLVDGARITATDSILGTAAYLSPEQVRGAAPRPESDVYSLGLVLLEALNGERAFPGSAAEAAMARLHRPPTLPADASPALADLLSRMTALDPEHRPSAAAVASALREQLVGRVTVPDAAQTAPTPVAGLMTVPARPLHADSTMPQEPLFTPSRGMPISGPVRPIGARKPGRRFPTVLAVAASVLAAATAGVAISAASGINPKTAGAAAADAAAPPAPATAAPQQNGSSGAAAGFDLSRLHSGPSASPTPTTTPGTATPTPGSTGSSTPTPTPTPSSTPSSTPTASAPVPGPTSTDPSTADPSDTPTDGSSGDPSTDPSAPADDASAV